MSKLDDIEMACSWCNRLHPITAEGIQQIKALMLELVGKDVIPEEYDDSSQLIDDHRDEHFRDIGSNQEKENLRRLIQAL